jgi:peptidoglycan LD-endopeptidase CwlK
MSRKLDDLSPKFKPKAIELLARCVEAGIPTMIIDTLRTQQEQAENIRKGVSWTKNSKHLPDLEGKSNAIDVCPYDVYQVHGPDKLLWDGNDAVWAKIGAIGEALGLTWGGRWAQKDLGHFEWKG